jgi:leader peptidase (prepilin peptidase)/N-methyltransferase
MIRILGTFFAGLLGLAFGSFLNVCLSRWPEGESIVRPRSHCRQCSYTLAWWENVPLVSWLALRGRCRKCGAWIGWRYPLVELAIGALWADCWYEYAPSAALIASTDAWAAASLSMAGLGIFYWILVGLAALDSEFLWLPDAVTLPGIALGVVFTVLRGVVYVTPSLHPSAMAVFLNCAFGMIAAGGLILVIRWVYWLIRRREGIGVGDAKLMALLAAWLGFPEALLALFIGVVFGAGVAVALLAFPSSRSKPGGWALEKLPLGTFVCLGGIVSGLWGEWMIAVYLSWARW